MRYRTLVWPCLLAVFLLHRISPSAAVESVYPGKTWTAKAPAEVGMDPGKLDAFSEYVGGRGCVVRHGYMVYTWGDVSRRADVASACKPVYTHFLLKALEDQKIPSLDQKVTAWEPRLNDINKQLGYKDRDITWQHMANQISCYGLVEKPGTAYAYNDWQMALFWDTLFLKVYGATYENVDEKVLHPEFIDVLGCQDKPTLMAFGTRNRPGRVGISVRDFARFGLLYLRQGNWKGRQVITAEHARMAVRGPLPNSIPRAGNEAAEMIPGQRSIGSGSIPDNQTDHFGSYSWLWWINGVDRNGTRMWPDAPHDTFGAFGHGGPRATWVIPSLDVVVSYNDAKLRGWTSGEKSPTNRAMKLLVEACRKKPENPRSTGMYFPPPAWPSTLLTTLLAQPERKDLGYIGRFGKWAKVEIALTGPGSLGEGQPNPFDIFVDGVFTSPTGKQYEVPGFYDGDGKGDLDGNVWRVRFSADETGKWTFACRSKNRLLDGWKGWFSVVAVPDGAAGFYRWGRLEAVGTASNQIRYMKFRDGPYWLKAGCDDPENFLGGYKNYDTLAKRKAAVDYLAAKGINSLYMMTHNIGGDDKDVWPWLGGTAREAMSNAGREARFDVAKLDGWRQLFETMQAKGVVPYLVLEDDSAWKEYDHPRYYRELIARFGDLPAVIFNFNEEHNENYRLPDALAFVRQLKDMDPYDHPRGIHNVNHPNDQYVDAPQVDFTSIQTGSPGRHSGATMHNKLSIAWINRCKSRQKRVLMVGFDEGRPEEDRRSWWSAYLGGGVWEAHVLGPYDRPMSAWESVWTELGGARAFMESLPFWEMTPDNDPVKSGTAFCLAKPGEVYALYLPQGGSVTVELTPGENFESAWWKATNGTTAQFQHASRIHGGRRELTAPGAGDWALRIVKE